MARRNKNQVTLTFAGDASQLNRAFSQVGDSAKEMSGEVGDASKEMRNSGESFDRAGGKVGETEQKLRGFRDIVDGSGDAVRGFATGDISLMTMGLADIAAGSADLVIPALKRMVTWLSNTKIGMAATTVATRTFAAAQKALNLVMRANPIVLILTLLAALVGAIVLAYKQSETFRKIVDKAFSVVKDVAETAFNWIKDNWKLLLGIITGPIGAAVLLVTSHWDKIKDAASDAIDFIKSIVSDIGDTISAPFRGAFDSVRDAWNSTLGGKGFSTPSWLPGIGGKEFRIPRLHGGGVVPGAPGQERLALLQSGERVSPAGRGGGAVIEIRSGGTALDDALVEILARAVSARGGDVQLVLGSA